MAEISLLRRVAGPSLRERVRSSVTWEELRVKPLLIHIEGSQMKWLGHLSHHEETSEKTQDTLD